MDDGSGGTSPTTTKSFVLFVSIPGLLGHTLRMRSLMKVHDFSKRPAANERCRS